FLQLVDYFSFAPDGDVPGLEIIFYVDAHLAFGQIPDVSYRSNDFVVLSQEFAYGVGLCRRFHYYKVVCHHFLLDCVYIGTLQFAAMPRTLLRCRNHAVDPVDEYKSYITTFCVQVYYNDDDFIRQVIQQACSICPAVARRSRSVPASGVSKKPSGHLSRSPWI